MPPTEVGSQLLAQAETYALPYLGRRSVDKDARALLLVMCCHALDHDPHPWYSGGWEPLARALGIDTTKPTSAQVMVSRALAPLVDAGYIERTYETTYGRNLGRAAVARWTLHVGPDSCGKPTNEAVDNSDPEGPAS